MKSFSTHLLPHPILFILYEWTQVDRDQIVNLVDRTLQHFTIIGGDMKIQRWVSVRRL